MAVLAAVTAGRVRHDLSRGSDQPWHCHSSRNAGYVSQCTDIAACGVVVVVVTVLPVCGHVVMF